MRMSPSVRSGSTGSMPARGSEKRESRTGGPGRRVPERGCPAKSVTQKFYTLRNLWYTRHNSGQHLDIEGGWSLHGNEEGSREEARKEGGEEEEVGTTRRRRPRRLLTLLPLYISSDPNQTHRTGKYLTLSLSKGAQYFDMSSRHEPMRMILNPTRIFLSTGCRGSYPRKSLGSDSTRAPFHNPREQAASKMLPQVGTALSFGRVSVC